MIAADTSSIVAFLKGENGPDVEQLRASATLGEIALPPVVVAELFSDPSLGKPAEEIVGQFALLPVDDGHWRRAAENRRLLSLRGLKAKTADALIAQACIDNSVALITRDADFRHFAKHCALRLA